MPIQAPDAAMPLQPQGTPLLLKPPGTVLPMQPVNMAMQPQLLPPGADQPYYQHGDSLQWYGHDHVQI